MSHNDLLGNCDTLRRIRLKIFNSKRFGNRFGNVEITVDLGLAA